jgi:hypothetical protein
MPALRLYWNKARKFNPKKKGHESPGDWWALRPLEDLTPLIVLEDAA